MDISIDRGLPIFSSRSVPLIRPTEGNQTNNLVEPPKTIQVGRETL